MNLDRKQAARAAGALLGAAVGDALGVPYEFARKLGPKDVPFMEGGGLGNYAPGEYSDDTQMAVMIAEVAVTGADLRTRKALDAVAANFLRWRRDGASDIGSQTSSVLGGTRRTLETSPRTRRHRWVPFASRPLGAGEVMTAASHALHADTRHTAGNGSLMRTAPVALRYLRDPAACAAAARAVSTLTHYDPLAGDACVIWCEAIRRAVLGHKDPGDGIASGIALLPLAHRHRWEEWVNAAEVYEPAHFNPNGYVVPALQAAYSAICRSRGSGPELPFRRGLYEAVRAGNDTDTVAAIAGALLGALHGVDAIPQDWRASVKGWPDMTGRTLEELAIGIARQS